MQIKAGGRIIDVQPTAIDRLVGWFDPQKGVERLRARATMASIGGYDGGRRERRATKRWRPGQASADADILGDLPDLRGRARDLARNVPIAAGAINTKVTGVLGEGLRLQASIDHEALGITEEEADRMEREQEREWTLFSATADFTKVQHFDELQSLMMRSADESGDVFVIRRYRADKGDVYGTKLQVIEADRVSNPSYGMDSEEIAGGVEIDKNGVHVAYHIANRHQIEAHGATATKWERVPAMTRDGRKLVIHLFERTRPEQTRGAPYLAPVIELLKQLGNYSDAEVTAAVISAMFTLAIETAADDDMNPIIGEHDSSLDDNEVKLGNGAVISLAPGEKANPINPGRPNANFDPFFQSMCRQIGVALELPYELLIKHFTASYSASRAALEMAWQYFRKQRAWFARRICQTSYEWMMEEAVASGRLNRPGFFTDPIARMAYVDANWIGPSRISLDPLKEAKADAVDVLELGVKTREQVCLERAGGQIEKKAPQLAKERRLLVDAMPEPAQSATGANAQRPPDDEIDAEDE
jgi:lambda family phage portal protein